MLIEKIRAIDPDWNPDIHGADGGLISLGVDVPTATTGAAAAIPVPTVVATAVPAVEASPKTAEIRRLREQAAAQKAALSSYRVRLEAAHVAVLAAKDSARR